MIFGLLITLYVIICIFLILIILVQKGKGSMGIGNLGGGTQLLFGSSGGQDLFQKITWVLAAIFMASSMFLAIMKTRNSKEFTKYTIAQKQALAAQANTPVEPVQAAQEAAAQEESN